MKITDLVFVGFNSRVAALHRETGELIWKWRSPRGSGYVTLLVDGDHLIATVNGYTYCLDPLTGETRWFNKLAGMGTGVATIATVHGATSNPAAAANEITQATAAGTAGAT